MAKLPTLQVGERKDGVWRRRIDCYVVSIRINGKLHQKSFGDDQQAATLYANRVKQEAKLEKLRGDNPLLEQIIQKRIPDTTFKDIVLAYANSRQPFLKPGTVEFYRYLIQRLKPLSHETVKSLDLEKVNQFLGELKLQGLSNKIIKEVICFCKSSYQLAIETGKIPPTVNIFNQVKLPKVSKHEPEPFSKDELTRIFGQLNPRLRLMFWLQLSTGMRTGEILALRFESIDFERKRIRVKKTRRHGIENEPKTSHSLRDVFLPQDLSDDLKRNKEVRNATDLDYVFVTQYGLPYTDVPVQPWKEALKRANVKYRQPYNLRHSYASHALGNKIQLAYVSKSMGHENVNVTAEKYIRYIDDWNKEDESRLESISKVYRKSSPDISEP